MLQLLVIYAFVRPAYPWPLRKRADASRPTVWIPIVVVGVFVLVVALLTLRLKPDWRRKIVHLVSTPCHSASRDTRELTAEQLAGVQSRDNRSAEQPRTTRRTRRNRRRPSQISVTSLPAYNTQAGDNELVVNMGETPRPMSELPTTLPVTTLTTASPPEAQRTEEPPQMTPLSSVDLMPSQPSPTHDSSISATDTNGIAPGYSGDQSGSNAMPLLPLASQTSSSRRSAIRSLLPTFNRTRTIPSYNSNGANDSAENDPASANSQALQPRTHRPSQSASVHSLSLAPFRTISRQRSSQTLNSNRLSSPSVISVNSISAPLRATVIKTEFVYPQSGPTPDQVKLISSRESLGRFGRPYGSEAIAYAASRSRLGLMEPPPEFEASTNPEQSLESNSRNLMSAESPSSSSAIDSNPGPGSDPCPPYQTPQLAARREPSAYDAPPVSFRMNSEERSQSRASTWTGVSFATAREAQSEDGQSSCSLDSARHALEETDATIVPTTHP